MNFEDESYVKVYKRQTLGGKMLGWDGRAVLRAVFMHVDRAGILDLDGSEPAQAIAALEEMPIDHARSGMLKLIERGTVVIHKGVLFVPKFLEAQEARQSDAQRQREFRAARVAKKRADALGLDVTKCDEPISETENEAPRTPASLPKSVTKRDQEPDWSSQHVTNPHGASSQNVTNPPTAGHAQKRPEQIRDKEPLPIQDLTGNAHEAPVVVGGESPSELIDCPSDLTLTEGQRAQLRMNLGANDYQIKTLELRFRMASEGAARRPLSAWRKCMGKAVASEWSNGKRRPPASADEETPQQTARRLKEGPRQGLAHDHTDQAAHLDVIGANQI